MPYRSKAIHAALPPSISMIEHGIYPAFIWTFVVFTTAPLLLMAYGVRKRCPEWTLGHAIRLQMLSLAMPWVPLLALVVERMVTAPVGVASEARTSRMDGMVAIATVGIVASYPVFALVVAVLLAIMTTIHRKTAPSRKAIVASSTAEATTGHQRRQAERRALRLHWSRILALFSFLSWGFGGCALLLLQAYGVVAGPVPVRSITMVLVSLAPTWAVVALLFYRVGRSREIMEAKGFLHLVSEGLRIYLYMLAPAQRVRSKKSDSTAQDVEKGSGYSRILREVGADTPSNRQESVEQASSPA